MEIEMNIDRKFEPYKLIPTGKLYKVENFDVENLMSNNINKSKIIKTNNKYEMNVSIKKEKKQKQNEVIIKQKIKINKMEYLKSFFDGLVFLKKGLHSFKVNGYIFLDALNIYNFLFKNSKKISGIDILKLRKLLKKIKKTMFKFFCKNAKIALKE
jgi:hypothetical protein